jgi:hypothetical protein
MGKGATSELSTSDTDLLNTGQPQPSGPARETLIASKIQVYNGPHPSLAIIY